MNAGGTAELSEAFTWFNSIFKAAMVSYGGNVHLVREGDRQTEREGEQITASSRARPLVAPLVVGLVSRHLLDSGSHYLTSFSSAPLRYASWLGWH